VIFSRRPLRRLAVDAREQARSRILTILRLLARLAADRNDDESASRTSANSWNAIPTTRRLVSSHRRAAGLAPSRRGAPALRGLRQANGELDVVPVAWRMPRAGDLKGHLGATQRLASDSRGRANLRRPASRGLRWPRRKGRCHSRLRGVVDDVGTDCGHVSQRPGAPGRSAELVE